MCARFKQGKLLTLLVLNKALALDRKDGQHKKRNPIRETLFKILQDHCSLSDLLSGNGITYQEASKFTQDLSATLESVRPTEQCECEPWPQPLSLLGLRSFSFTCTDRAFLHVSCSSTSYWR